MRRDARGDGNSDFSISSRRVEGRAERHVAQWLALPEPHLASNDYQTAYDRKQCEPLGFPVVDQVGSIFPDRELFHRRLRRLDGASKNRYLEHAKKIALAFHDHWRLLKRPRRRRAPG